MSDLKERFRVLDAQPAPDLWIEIEQRKPGPLPPLPSRHPVGAISVAIVVAALGIGIAVPAFLGHQTVQSPVGPAPGVLPTPTPEFHVAHGSRPGWKRYIDPFYRVSVEVPDSWTVRDPSSGPLGAYTVVAAGSWPFPIGEDQDGCAPRPALNALPRDGAFIWWQEQGTGFPPRPKAFRFPRPGPVECAGGHTFLIDFRAGGRFFQVQVRLGPRASESRRRTVLQVLDGFRAEKG